MAKNSKTVSLNGLRVLGVIAQRKYEHERITEKELARPFYYSRWYNCPNHDCKTTTIVPDEFKVFSKDQAQRLHDVDDDRPRRQCCTAGEISPA